MISYFIIFICLSSIFFYTMRPVYASHICYTYWIQWIFKFFICPETNQVTKSSSVPSGHIAVRGCVVATLSCWIAQQDLTRQFHRGSWLISAKTTKKVHIFGNWSRSSCRTNKNSDQTKLPSWGMESDLHTTKCAQLGQASPCPNSVFVRFIVALTQKHRVVAAVTWSTTIFAPSFCATLLWFTFWLTN